LIRVSDAEMMQLLSEGWGEISEQSPTATHDAVFVAGGSSTADKLNCLSRYV